MPRVAAAAVGDHEEWDGVVTEWLEHPSPDWLKRKKTPILAFYKSLVGMGLFSEPWMMTIMKTGYTRMSVLASDLASEEQLDAASKTTLMQSIADLSGLLSSIGIVSALVLSLIFPIIVVDLQPSAASTDYFDGPTIAGMYYLNRTLLIVSVFECILLIFKTTKMYWEASVLCVGDKMKKFWRGTCRIGPLLDQLDIIVYFVGGSIPLAIALYNPVLGAISLIVCIIFVLRIALTYASHAEIFAELHSYLRARASLQTRRHQKNFDRKLDL